MRMRHRALMLSLLITSCRHGSAANASHGDVDVAALRSRLGCRGAATQPERMEMCRILDEFAAGTTPSDFPTEGVRFWIGVQHCARQQAGGDYEMLKVRPGIAPRETLAMFGVTESQALPFMISNPTANATAPEIIAAYERLIASLTAGQTPVLDAELSGANDPRATIPDDSSFAPLLRTTGASVYGGNHAALLIALRASGRRLILVRPEMQGGCVAELHRFDGP